MLHRYKHTWPILKEFCNLYDVDPNLPSKAMGILKAKYNPDLTVTLMKNTWEISEGNSNYYMVHAEFRYYESGFFAQCFIGLEGLCVTICF